MSAPPPPRSIRARSSRPSRRCDERRSRVVNRAGGGDGPSQIRPWWYTRLGHDPRNPDTGGDSGFPQLDLGQLWSARGIPCLYFGEEIEFMKGAPQDVIGNDDTLDTTGRAYFGDHLTDHRIGETQNHPLYRHIRRLNQIRRAVPALQKAAMSHMREWGSGLSFVRDLDDGLSNAVVGLTIGGGRDITVSGVRDGLYRDAVTGNEITAHGGTLSFHVKGNSAGIYVLDGPGEIGEDGVYLR